MTRAGRWVLMNFTLATPRVTLLIVMYRFMVALIRRLRLVMIRLVMWWVRFRGWIGRCFRRNGRRLIVGHSVCGCLLP